MFRLFKKKAKRAALTGRTMDVRQRRWGWNLTMMRLEEGTQEGTTLGWCSPLPKPGDLMMWDVNGNRITVLVTKVEPMRDPEDMFKAWFVIHSREPVTTP